MARTLRLLAIVAVTAAVAAAGFWGWKAYAKRGIAGGPHVKLCPGKEGCRQVFDVAGVLPPGDVPRFEQYMGHIHRESDVDIRFVFVRDTGGRRLEELATALVEELRIGGRTREERGVLLLYDMASKRLKVEVGYGLEGFFPDAFVNYLVRDHARLFFASGNLSVGLRLMLRLLQHRIREAVLGESFDPAALEGLPSATHLSGGAGVTSALPRVEGAPDVPAGRLDAALRERFVAQDSPREAYGRYLEWLAQPVYDPDVDLFTGATRRYLAGFPLSPAYAEFILLGERGKRFRMVERGDLAILYFIGTPFTSPHFFVREAGRWRMDIAAEVRNTREYVGGRFNWGYVGKDDPHTRAFADLLVNLRGVRRFRDGDNRELPIRGAQGL
jgi:uncharacterized protein